MLKRFQLAAASLYKMETKVRQTPNAAGVHIIMYVPYLNYARQLYKLSRQQGISGESFALGTEVLPQKWTARGLDSAVLARIRTGVFDVVAPAPQARVPSTRPPDAWLLREGIGLRPLDCEVLRG
jgi:hypothetical protein